MKRSHQILSLFANVQIVLVNGSESDPEPNHSDRNSVPVDLELEWVLGKMPRKVPTLITTHCIGSLFCYSMGGAVLHS